MRTATDETTATPIDHATEADVQAAVAVLAAAFVDGPVSRWLAPDATTRLDLSHAYFGAAVDQARAAGHVHVALSGTVDGTAGPGREVVGVALWLAHLAPVPFRPAPTTVSADTPDDLLAVRLQVLDALLAARHPAEAHHHLAYLAVRPDRQRRGIGSQLLRHHHGLLDAALVPAYLEANHPRNRELYLRHGYVDDTPTRLPDGSPIWPMWRAPGAPGRL